MEFLTTQKLPEDWTKEERRKIRINNRHFAVVGHMLFRRGANGLLRRCVSEVEVYEPKMVAHNCFMFRIYLELQLSSLLKQLKVLKRLRLGVELCFRP